MQSYAIFNKHNRILITKNIVKNVFFENSKIIKASENVLENFDFNTLFAEDNTQNYIILTENNNIESIFQKVTSFFYFVKAAGGIVINEKGEYLFMFRNNMWDLPKGHWEKGEEIQETAKREVLEECGMKNLEVGEYVFSTFHTYSMHGRKEIKRTYWYKMTCSSKEKLYPQHEEGIQKLEWIPKTNIQHILDASYPNIQYLFYNLPPL